MRINLFGELCVEPSDIAEVVVKEFQKQYGIRFEQELRVQLFIVYIKMVFHNTLDRQLIMMVCELD